MLAHLTIRDFIIVEHMELEFHAGMTVLTGETGAGKSILVDALSLALGGRTRPDLVRPGCERAEVAAEFRLARESLAREWLIANELDRGGECLLRRTWSRDSRSRAFVNGSPMSVQSIREFAELLVDVHGQQTNQQLLHRDAHRRLLDEFCGNQALLMSIEQHWIRVSAIRREIDDQMSVIGNNADRRELLRYQLEELRTFAPIEGEFEALTHEHQRLSRRNELLAACSMAVEALDGDASGARHLLSDARRLLVTVASLSSRLSTILDELDTAAVNIDEAAAELRDLAQVQDENPDRLTQVEQRLERQHELARKHQARPSDLTKTLGRFEHELNGIDEARANLARLSEILADEVDLYNSVSAQLHERRAAGAIPLATTVTTEVRRLGMPGALFEVGIEHEPEAHSRHGQDRVEFLVATNPGQPPQPLARVASGGELSRIGLAIEAVTSGGTGVPTLVFDEIDAGIGGAVAEVVGMLMRRLAETRQVLCVTHLAQVAARAQNHLSVSKTLKNGTAVAQVEAVAGERRLEEVARMIGGQRITQRTRAHAQELLSTT